MLDTLLHVVVLLAMPPLLQGVIVKTKARFAGRVGAPVLQPYHDLAKLFRKGGIRSITTTWVFLAGPAVTCVATLLAGMLVPLGEHVSPVHFSGDIVLFVYLMALGRFFTAVAALDTGSAFEGMGAAREVTFACFAEVALFLGILALARTSGSLEVSGLLSSGLQEAWRSATPTIVLVTTGLFVVLLVENCRIPFDDPNTHLELTMIHEVMVLDHGGPALGAILYGAAMKLFLFSAIVARLLVPVSSGVSLLDWGIFIVAVTMVAVTVGVVESIMARLRLVLVPNLLIGAALLTGLGFVLLVR
jgi:formate hydrogenlyase subunit 4